MPKYQMQNFQLQNILNGLNQLTNNPALAILLDDKIKRLQNNNAILIKVLIKRCDELVEKYVAHDENLKPKTQTDDKGVLVYVFETPELEEQYKDEMTEFLNRTITIEI